MILYCALIALLPALVALGFYLFTKKTDHLAAAGITYVACLLISLGIFYAIRGSKVMDTELLNGRVTSKYSEHVSCSHSYQCHCRMVTTGSGKNATTSEVCDTCYEHLYDVDWVVASTVGNIDIDRVDRQGVDEPPRYSKVWVGEPFSTEHSYDNYLLIDLGSVLFGQKGDVNRFKASLPDYPQVYDYYHVNHAISEGVAISPQDMYNWNYMLDHINSDLGAKKQVTINVILANTSDAAYAYALKDWWHGGKKNDADIVIGTTDGHKIDFVKVVTWETNADYTVNLENDIQNVGTIDRRDLIDSFIRSDTDKYFTRLHMKNYKYMLNDFSPDTTLVGWLVVIFTLISIGTNIWLNSQDSYHSYNSY